MLTIVATANAENISPPGAGGKAPSSGVLKPPSANAGSTTPGSPGICPQTRTIGPFLTGDEAELGAEAARYQGLLASPVYEQGFPDSYFNPVRYYFDVQILGPCYAH
jgi:hypothetical protein